MNAIRSSIKCQVLDLNTLPVFSPLKRGIKLFDCNLEIGTNMV